MVIGGFQKFSLSDFPGHISAIIFTRGCGFRCPYCHNPELVDPCRYAPALSTETVLAFLESRRGLLQGVVISGGEPTIHAGLPDLLAAIKAMGFAVKLDTNGSNPSLLEHLLTQGLCDYVAMDLKAPLDSYHRLAGVPVDPAAIRRSLELVVGSGIPHEIRTTYLESLLSDDDLSRIGELAKGCLRFFLQIYRATKSLEPSLLRTPRPSESRIRSLKSLLEAHGLPVQVR
jgi:pyruvate formate lyase activating enzyme